MPPSWRPICCRAVLCTNRIAVSAERCVMLVLAAHPDIAVTSIVYSSSDSAMPDLRISASIATACHDANAFDRAA
jgi:hypothetical protein